MSNFIVYDCVLGGTNIRQVRSASFQEQIETLVARLTGIPGISEIYAVNSDPRVSLETGNIAAVSTAMFLQQGIVLGDEAASTPVQIAIPWAKRAAGVTMGAAGTHVAIRGATAGAGYGVFVVDSIRASQGQAATAQLTGGFHNKNAHLNTAPFDIDVAYTAASQAFVGEYTVGPATIELDEESPITVYPTDITITPGCQLTKLDNAAGTIYPANHYILEVKPTIDLTFRDKSQLGIFGGPKKITSMVAYLRKLLDGSIVAADDASTHANYSFAGGVASVETVQSSGQAPGSTTLRFHGKTLAVSLTSTMPA